MDMWYSILSLNCYILIVFIQSEDYLTIDEGTGNIYNQTGPIYPRSITSSNSNLIIHFKSSVNGGEKGFQIVVSYILQGIYVW